MNCMVLGMAWDEIRGYDNSDLQSVLQRARKMLGMELREIDMEIRGTSEFNSSNRGYAGLVIESWFVDGTNEAGPDLPNVPHPTLDHVGLEIKAVPLRRGKKKPWLVGEPMSLTMINYSEIYQNSEITPIHDSIIFSKDRWTLVIYYHLSSENKPSGKILGLGLWDLEHLNFDQIMGEYIRACELIIRGNADRLSESMFKSGTLSARVKSSSGGIRPAGPTGKSATPRVWALKTKYVRKRLEKDGLNGDITLDGVTMSKSKIYRERFEKVVQRKPLNRLGVNPLSIPISNDDRRMIRFFTENAVGKTVQEVADFLDYPMSWSKDLHSRVVRKLLHSRPGGLGEKGSLRATEINGSLLKIFYVDAEMKPTEGGVRFPHIPLSEIANEDFESSTLLSFMEHILFIPVQKNETMSQSVFLSPFYWIPRNAQLREISEEWHMFQQGIAQGLAKRLPNGRHRLPTRKNTKWIHMRPSPAGGTEKDTLGNDCTKMCFWLNDKAVQELYGNRQTGFSYFRRGEDRDLH